MSLVKLSYDGIHQLLSADFMEAEMLKRADSVRAAAEAAAPVLEDGPHPGRYKNAFTVSSGTNKISTVTGRRRAYGRVENSAPEAYAVEYGTKNNPRHRTLGTALDAARD